MSRFPKHGSQKVAYDNPVDTATAMMLLLDRSWHAGPVEAKTCSWGVVVLVLASHCSVAKEDLKQLASRQPSQLDCLH